MFLTILSTLLVAVISYLYLNEIYNRNYWKKRGMPYNSKNSYMGPMFQFLFSRKSGAQLVHDIYEANPDAPAIGVNSFLRPAFLVKDITNVQFILTTDFNSFSHRGVEIDENDVLANSILFNNGRRWKLMRQHMTPLFTSSKLRTMYHIMDKSAQDFVDYLKKNPQYLNGNAFDTLTTFCAAAMGAAVFGIGTESVFDSPFLKMARKASILTPKQNFFIALSNVSPRTAKFFGISLFKEFEDFFIGAIKNIIQTRKQDDVKGHGFADICVNLQKNGVLKDDDTALELEPTDELLAAQAFFFFIAGVDPSASAMFATLIELSRHSEELAKVHKEIDDNFEKHGNISHDVLCSMEYMDMAINEAMRLHPSVGFITRQCVKDTVLPVGNIKIDKGTNVFISGYSLQHDAKYFPDPKAFKPERFSKENKPRFVETAYMPFGMGNRICIGNRYAQLQVKAGLVHLLRNYTVKLIMSDDHFKYNKELATMRITNVNLQFIPRL